MLSTAIIVFRESFEIAIVVAILAAATRGLRGRALWIGAGIAAGLVVAGLLGFFADRLDALLAGKGSDLVQAGFLAATVVMIAWTVWWMKKHGRAAAGEARRLGAAVIEGSKPGYTLAIAVGAASVRDGSELVVFLYGLALSQELTVAGVIAGAAIGVAIGAGLGALMYYGIVKVAPKHLFVVVGLLLAFLGAGMAAQCVSLLISADVVPAWVDPVWDLSETLPETGTVGQLLRAVFGYVSRPAGTQLLAYLAAFAFIAVLALGRPPRRSPTPATA
ncbi:MAG: FTR1 family protein [Rhodospirillaceae bacterium]|nr:FTR1 family protein [Rhodospirillaceae bacterium]